MVRRTIPTGIALFFLSGTIIPAPSRAAERDLSLDEASADGVTFTYHPGPVEWVTSSDETYPLVRGAAINHRDGYPSVPGRIIYVALPPGSESVAAVLRDRSEVVPVSHPEYRFTNSGQLAAAGGIYPPERVVVDGIFTIDGVRMARLILHPLIIAAAAAEADLLSFMQVQVRFDRMGVISNTAGSIPAAARARVFDRILGQVCINPQQAVMWRERSQAAASTQVASDPFAGSDEWVAIRVRREGVVRLLGSDLDGIGVNLNTIDPAHIRLFMSEGRQLSTLMADPAPDFREAAIAVKGGGDGRFDASDEAIFWAPGLNRWEFNANGDPVDVVHRYDRDNVFWLTWSGEFPAAPRRLETTPSLTPDESDLTVFSTPDRVRREDEKIFRIGSFGEIESYYTWYWRNLESGVVSTFGVTAAVPGGSARFMVSSWAGNAGRVPARLTVNGGAVAPTSFAPWAGEDKTTLTHFDIADFDPQARYVVDFSAAAGTDNFYLDYVTIDYERQLDLSSGPLKFAAPDTAAAATFVIANAAEAVVWDITDPWTPLQIGDPAVDGSVLRFAAALDSVSRRIYFADLPAQRLRPRSLELVHPVDLHTPATGADYLVIGPRAFADAAAGFLSYRAATDGLVTRFVAREDIVNSFAYGVSDPVAIRRFLAYAFHNWPQPAPAYVLLLGDGSYDFLDNTRSGSVNYMPPYITADDNTISDEHYVYFSDRYVLNAEPPDVIPENPFPDMIVGRWPVRSATEVQTLTDKIKRYESSENPGPWRSRVMLAADDEYGDRTAAIPSVSEEIHTRDAERIAREVIPPRVDLEKIYLTEYPFSNPGCVQPGARGCRKPAAKEAIVAGLNEGVAVFDYIGHGNMDLMAHERVFERALDLPRLVNPETPTVVLTFSCSIGFFDHPSREGMSEEWLRMPSGGAVSVVSATRLTRATANAELNIEAFDLLFNKGITGIGEAVYTAKLLRQYHDPICALLSGCPDGPPCPCDNDRGYMLLGDPAMRLGIPQNRVVIDSILPDSLVALSRAHVAGHIVNTDGIDDETFAGNVAVTVRDAPRSRLHRIIYDDDSIRYDLPGGILFRGETAVDGGRFDFDFVVPKDIAYGQTGARILAHASARSAMAAGASPSLRLAALAGELTDTAGPTVVLLAASGERVADGFGVPQSAVLTLVIEDSSGINLTGAPGHRLLVFVDDAGEPWADLTETFSYDPQTAVRGRATIALSGLPLGTHRITVRAWDNANNSTVVTYSVAIVEESAAGQFRITEFLGYPNPLNEATTFYFRASRAIAAATVRVFTVRGRLIWEARNAADGELTWGATDDAGDPVANGVYLAQIEATGRVLTGGAMVDKKAYRETKLVVSR